MTHALVLGRRALREGIRTPEAIVPTLFIPLFFLVVNVGQAAKIFPGSTTDFLHGQGYGAFQLPSSMLLAASFGSAALFLVEEIEGGYFDKLRATPVRRSAIILGRLIAEAAKALLIASLIVLLGLVFGIRIASGPLGFVLLVVLTAGWAVVRDKTVNKEYDASHMLSPMPLALSLGLGSQPVPFAVPAIENINGQGITLAIKHKDKRDPKQWKGFKFAIPFDYSMHNYLLRYYLAEHGIDPEGDVQLRVVPPPEMVANLRADNIDGFLAPDNICQRAIYDGVGFLHILSKEIWDGHPCCSFTASKEFITQMPNSYAALVRAIVDATAFASKAENRKQIAETIAPANYLNQPPIVVEQALTGTFADGLGGVRKDEKRVDFDPFPWQSFAVWMLTQMKRWGQIKGEIDYQGIAEQVFLATDTAKLMREMGLTPPATASKSFVVMGKTFDPARPDEYLKSFSIKRS